MDYIGNKCPVCDKYFHIGDDIVVCPDCGTPHHRECYQSIQGCANADRHKDGFDYQEELKKENSSNDSFTVECKKCGNKNSSDAFFCNKCGNALHENNANNVNNQHNNQGQPFSSSPFPQNGNVIMFDPLAGVSPSADIGDGITAGEAAKFVRQNTPYFITVFSNIKRFAKSRFNFCAMMFGGGYLLYRKMYKLGAFITAIQAAITILYMYLNYYIESNNVFDKLLEASAQSDYNAFLLYYTQLPAKEHYYLILFMLLAFVSLAFYIVIGACANRMYYKHCKKEILKIKSEAKEPAKISEALVKRGGVNIPLGLSLWFTYLVISYLPLFFS